MDDLEGTVGLVALAAAAVALIALLLAATLAVRVRRMRIAQMAVLGDHGEDLVAHAAALQREFAALHDMVHDAQERLTARVAAAEQRLDGAVSHTGLVRYDAYREMSGRQSTSIALLDARRSGIVLSAIHHRDQARLYCKLLHEGEPSVPFSPEESAAVERALAGDPSEEL